VTRFVVVTGTDTGVGKTYVAEALTRLLARTQRVVAIKPFESGLAENEPGDAERLAEASLQTAPRHALRRFAAPLAPAMAAEREGVAIDFDVVLSEIRSLAAGADVALVEGAGGLLSPLTWTEDALTLARALDADVVLVASDRLGTLSVTHAAVEVLQARGRLPVAIVLSAPPVADASTCANASALRKRLAPFGDVAQRIVEIGRDDDGAEALASVIGWLSHTSRER
jgi:dethiobiotin synthetase